jgi:hypothetical protein
MIGIEMNATKPTYELDDPARPNVKAKYFDGIGLGSTFLDYLFDGATAYNIKKECTEVYKYIVANYTKEHEIWMFGLSRGAYTVRSVAGMINNCGILKELPLCDEVYKIYRSPYDSDRPNTDEMKLFKAKASHDVQTPIKFMGIIDTVGSAGIPKLDAGVGFNWPEFHDQKISSEVEKVYHALSLHDRLWIFQPCLATRDPKPGRPELSKLQIYERWFPGAHYDLGRQRFRFLRAGVNTVERVLFYIPNLLSNTIHPNEVLSDLVLKWMLENIKTEGGSGTDNAVIKDIDGVIEQIKEEIKIVNNNRVGDGDVYGNLLKYAPFGKLKPLLGSAVWLANKVLPAKAEIDTLEGILFNLRDRRVPGPGPVNTSTNNTVYTSWCDYTVGDPNLDNLAQITTRYPSKTLQTYLLYMEGRSGGSEVSST